MVKRKGSIPRRVIEIPLFKAQFSVHQVPVDKENKKQEKGFFFFLMCIYLDIH